MSDMSDMSDMNNMSIMFRATSNIPRGALCAMLHHHV